MRKIKELLPNEAYRFCDLSSFGFKTTEDIVTCEKEFIGQERAVSSIHFGLGMEHRGYNLYLAGPPRGRKNERDKGDFIRYF